MHRLSFSSRLRAGLPLALAAGLALTASACLSPAAKQSSAAGAGDRAAKAKPQSWWQRITQSQDSGEKPWHPGAVRPGKGLLGNDEDGYTLYRQGEAGSSDSAKPRKARR
ncbi:MAG: hypothetical protein F4027_17750 [Rhodospirillaceae bacterium]|nr:hypothetical protein [Rhodospirillaceae bacterium]MYH38542.1 hypothetical protein [Rhodospirillaceae bacterium]MYK16420.1 hypothetical protein [Rhodospirillaceae bacterium]MYK60356.1 hypothetical protein [Rhodospirillaceae bacterium]